MGLKINIKWEKKELTLEEKYKKQQKKIGILILLILLMILGFFVYEFKFAEKSIFDKGDKYEEYNPNYEEESNVSHAEAKETSNVSVDVTSEVTSNILSTDTSNTSNTSNTDNTDNTKVSSIKINDTNMTMVVGSTKKLDYTIYPDTAQDKNVSYKINDTSIATIDNNGIITAKKIGKTTINVTTSDGNKTVTANLTVLNSAIKVTGIKASSSSITISIGDTTKFNYSITPNDATNKDVTYSSSNTGVAKVDSNGKITGIKEGSAKISATTKDGNYSTEMTVTVKQSTVAVTKVNLSYTSTIQTVGKASSIQANVLPTNATSRNVTWSSSNTSVATVSGSASENIVGRIVCLKAGTTKITALAGGVSKSLDITCKNSILVNPEYVTLYKYMHPQSDNSFESVTLYVTSSDTASNIKYTVTPTASSRNVSSGISNNQYHLNINSMYLNQGKYTIKYDDKDVQLNMIPEKKDKVEINKIINDNGFEVDFSVKEEGQFLLYLTRIDENLSKEISIGNLYIKCSHNNNFIIHINLLFIFLYYILLI